MKKTIIYLITEGNRISLDLAFKICIFGDSGVGKTSLVERFIKDKFDLNIGPTMGVNISTKNLIIQDLKVNLQIWDFIGEERFRSLIQTYAHGAFGAIFMYDITNKSSLLNLTEWISLFQEKIIDRRKQIPKLIIGGKSDLHQNRKVNLEDTYFLSKSFEILDFIECSAKTGESVEQIFYLLTMEILKIAKFI